MFSISQRWVGSSVRAFQCMRTQCGKNAMIVLGPCIYMYRNKNMVSRTTLTTLFEDCLDKAFCRLHERIK